MDCRTFQKLLPPETMVRLTQRQNSAGLRHLAGHFGLIIGLGALIVLGVPGWPLLMLPLGIALCFLFTLEHEATHQTPFANVQLNETVGHLCGVLLILPFNWFRYFHLAHHRYTNQPGLDPELAEPKPETWAQYLWHVTGLPYWRSMIATTVSNARGRIDDTLIPQRAHGKVRREASLYLLFHATLLGTLWVSPLVVWLWVIPLLLGQPFLRLYLLAEHGRCPFVANMFENTRTTFTNRIVRFLAWNMPYHAEHHVLPMVPFHQLPALHQLTQEHLQSTSPSYSRFSADYVAGLQQSP